MKHVSTRVSGCILLFLSLHFTLLIQGQPVHNRIHPVLEPVNAVVYKMEGWQGKLQQAVLNNWILGLEDRNPYMTGMLEAVNKVNNNRLLPWSGEFAGKYLTSAVALYRLQADQQLNKTLRSLVEKLGRLQTPEGYLGPWPDEYALTGKMPAPYDFPETWDTWNHYHLMMGLLDYHHQFKDTLSLGICGRIGDLLCKQFLGHPEKMMDPEKTGWGKGGMEFNYSPIQALCRLYRETGKKDYLALARNIADEGFLRYGDFINRALANKPFFATHWNEGARWERLHAFMGLAELYWLTGKSDYKKAVEQIWWSIAATDIHNTGGFTTGEMAIGNPYTEGAIETCCTIAWQAFSVELLKLTGQPVIADLLEITQLNTAYASWDETGKWNTYHTGMSGRRWPSTKEIGFQIRPGTAELNCCSANAPRTIGILADWGIMKKRNGLVLNWYGPVELKTLAGDIPVNIRQVTDYPGSADILIHIDPEKEADFSLDLRIPFWSVHTSIQVNKEKITIAKPGTYYSIKRRWKHGDQIRLTLDLRPQLWPGEKNYTGYASVYSGPVLLAWRKPEDNIQVKQPDANWNNWPGILYQSDKPGAVLEGSFTSDQLHILYDVFPEGGILQVQIDQTEYAILDLYSDTLKQQVEWQSPVLNNGQHTFRIELLTRSNPAAKGKSARIRDVRSCSLPVFDGQHFNLIPEKTNASSPARLAYNTVDTSGKKVLLEDFNNAGKNNGFYYTWLPFQHTGKTLFSHTNPFRLLPVKGAQ